MTPTAGSLEPDRSRRFPVGASISVDELESDPYDALARLRSTEPVSWLPAIGAWFITRRDLAVEAMRDAERFTVDDPRFSTASVIGESMLSLDGPEHERHRGAFAPHFRPTVVRDEFEDLVVARARAIVAELVPKGTAELRTALAGPLAVETISAFLGLADIAPARVLDWYRHIAEAIVDVSLGRPVPPHGVDAIAQIHQRVAHAINSGTSPLLRSLDDRAVLRPEELTPATAVVMFGAIETSEGMTANALWHLLTHPESLDRVAGDRTLLAGAVEESLRLEPAAAVIDRYATSDVEIGGVTIPRRELVTISLLGANRDPEVFDQPDVYDIDRSNAAQHVTFVQGPHGCLGLHLARMETIAALDALLDLLPALRVVGDTSEPPSGLIFRKPAAVTARWG